MKIKRVLFFCLLILFVFAVQAMAFQDPAESNGPGLPEVAVAVATVMAVVQFIKVSLAKFGIVVDGKLAVVFTILACVGVSIYYWMQSQLPFSMEVIWFFVQVIIGAVGGYALIEKAGGTFTLKGLGGRVLKS